MPEIWRQFPCREVWLPYTADADSQERAVIRRHCIMAIPVSEIHCIAIVGHHNGGTHRPGSTRLKGCPRTAAIPLKLHFFQDTSGHKSPYLPSTTSTAWYRRTKPRDRLPSGHSAPESCVLKRCT